MTKKVLFYTDNIQNYKNDNTFLFLKESDFRGYENYVVYYNDIYSEDDITYVCSRKVLSVKNDFLHLDDPCINNTDFFDIIFIRKNPPFDIRYITYLYLLSKSNSFFVNNPRGILNNPEKIFSFNSTCPTIISENSDIITRFIKKNNQVILKPLYSYGGDSIIFLDNNYPSLKEIIKIYRERYNSPFVIQKYDPIAKNEGDTRVIILNGEILGFFKRDNNGNIINNICVGGKTFHTNLSRKTENLCKRVALFLKNNGIIFSGLDIIGETNLIEVNVTSPMGLLQLNDLYAISSEKVSWDCFERLYAEFRSS